MLQLIFAVGEFCFDAVPILKALAMRAVRRRIEVDVYQPLKPNFSQYWSHINDETYCLLAPLFVKITNHNRDNIERIRQISFRLKRRGFIKSRIVQEFLVFDEGWNAVSDIRVQPLEDFLGSRCVYGELSASTLYVVHEGERPVSELVFHLVGGAVRRYYHTIPWEWVWIPDTAPLRRLKRTGEFAKQEKGNDNEDSTSNPPTS